MKDLEGKGFRVRMTRSSDVYPTLGQRVSFANRIPDAIFVSIHFNSFVNSTAKGIETYALSPRGSALTIAVEYGITFWRATGEILKTLP